ncbi:MAG: TadE/TadG family type IV pilus assembly protein [Bradymonadaceae bacterium]
MRTGLKDTSPTKPHARIRRWVQRLALDEKGVSMTEFVICLPVFLLIFVGVVNLTKLQNESLAVKIRATNNLWSEAIPVSQSNISIHMQATISGASAGTHVVDHFRYPIADTLAVAKYGGLALTGHFGESGVLVTPIDAMADIWFSPPSSNLWDYIIIDPVDHDLDLSLTAGPVVNERPLTRDLVDDGLIGPMPSFSGPMAAINGAITMLGARPAMAAGIRYGIVVGEDSGSVEFAGRTHNVSAGYDTLVAPKPTPEVATVLVTRFAVESYKPYSGILGIEWSNGL